MRVKVGLTFFFLAMRGAIFGLADQLYTLKWYWKYPSFFLSDCRLLWKYLPLNSHKLCRLRWGNDYQCKPYGETPIKTLVDIAFVAKISQKDVVLELGCGRGRTCFWLAQCLKCDVIGIDAVTDFIKTGQNLIARANIANIQLICSDFFDAPFHRASIIYFYGTGQKESVWVDLAIWLANLPKSPLIITVGAQLSEYSPHYLLLGQFRAEFGWGKTEIYLQRFKAEKDFGVGSLS